MAICETLDEPLPDPQVVAEEAGLHHVSDSRPGIRRRRAGSGFTYVAPDGSRVTDKRIRQRIDALVIPPAWTDVWICTDPRGHVQATGRDAKGRKQYRYHDRWRAVRDSDKFQRLLLFGERLPDLRDRVDHDLALPGLPRDRVLALVVRLLDDTLIRIGNPEYASDNDSYGLTTLRNRHVEVTGRRIIFDFAGKSGVEQRVQVEDQRLARIVRKCHELGGYELFAYLDEDENEVDVSSSHVNEYVRETIGQACSAKDFRTWGGTAIALETLAGLERPTEDKDIERDVLVALDAAAEALGNTRTVCRQCYVHPAIPDSYRNDTLADHWRRARTTSRHRRAERAVLSVLESSDQVILGSAA